MDLPGPPRPRVSRETRLLLATILISVAVLWALARLRFADRPATPSPVPPLLTQLVTPPAFDALAAEVAKAEPRLLPSLAVVGSSSGPAAALRVRDALGAVLRPDGDPLPVHAQPVVAADPVSGLTLVTLPGAPAPELIAWSPERLDRARYMIAADASPPGVSLRPVFVGRLHPTEDARWPGRIWALPPRTDVAPGQFLFTMEGGLAGLSIAHGGGLALVPGATLLAAVNHLQADKPAAPGWMGVSVQSLTPPLAAATGSPGGVMVVAVDADGPASGKLAVMDVIEASGGEPISSLEDWSARTARLRSNDAINLRVRRRGAAMDVTVTAAAAPRPPDGPSLGLTLRPLPGQGSEVVAVAPASAAARAGIRQGDVIRAIGEVQSPSPSHVARVFADAPAARPLLVAIARGHAHHVVALEK